MSCSSEFNFGIKVFSRDQINMFSMGKNVKYPYVMYWYSQLTVKCLCCCSLYMPEKVLTGPLLTAEQRRIQKMAMHSRRRAHFRKALLEMREVMSGAQAEQLHRICVVSKNIIHASKYSVNMLKRNR